MLPYIAIPAAVTPEPGRSLDRAQINKHLDQRDPLLSSDSPNAEEPPTPGAGRGGRWEDGATPRSSGMPFSRNLAAKHRHKQPEGRTRRGGPKHHDFRPIISVKCGRRRKLGTYRLVVSRFFDMMVIVLGRSKAYRYRAEGARRPVST